MTHEQALALFRASSLAPHLETLAPRLAPCVNLVPRRTALTTLPRGASRLAGSPDVPSGFCWPHHQERPLSFLAQIDLAAMPPTEELPSKGWLYFFYDAIEQPWGREAGHRGSAAVFYLDREREQLERKRPPAGSVDARPFGGRWHSCALDAEAGFNAADSEDIAHEPLSLTTLDDRETYAVLANPLNERPHMLGHPLHLQGDMRRHCERFALRFPGEEPAAEHDAAATRARLADWRLLLQLTSGREGPGWRWGDAGAIYFWIRRSDLRARRFSRCWVVLQC